MSTPGNESSGRHREATTTRPASLFKPTSGPDGSTATLTDRAPTGDGSGTAAERASAAAHATAGRASGAAHAAADRASGAARGAADRLSLMRSSLAAHKPAKDAGPPPVDEPSVGDLVRDASMHASTLIRSEIELAKAELTATVKKAIIGGALFLVAAVVLLYSLTFGLVGAAEAIHSSGGMPRWASYLLVLAGLWLIAGVASVIGLLLMKRMKKPERTLTTVRDTAAWAKSRGKSD